MVDPIVEAIQYGVDPDNLDYLVGALASDMTLQRPVELRVERLMELERRMAWRRRKVGGAFFTEREVEALTLERYAMSPTRFGKPHVESGVKEYIARRMGCTPRWVNKLLKSADRFMLWLSLADERYAGWINEGTRQQPVWKLQVPTAPQVDSALVLVDAALELMRRAA